MIKTYVKIALRTLVRYKSYTLLNVFGLSLGLAGGIIIFLLVRFHLSTDHYHKNFSTIYRVVLDLKLEDNYVEHDRGSAYLLHQTLKRDYPMVKNAALYVQYPDLTMAIQQKNSAKIDRYAEKKGVVFVNPDFFQVFDYQWLKGNPSTFDEPNTVVLTEKMAKKYFGNENPIGKLIQANNEFTFKVTGLLKDHPDNTDFDAEMFISLPTFKIVKPDFGFNDWAWIEGTKQTFITLNNKATQTQFEQLMPALSKKYYGQDAKYYNFLLQPLGNMHFNLDYPDGKIRKTTVWILAFIGFFLVMTACINFVNLATAQALNRSKEVGVRKTLGSTKSQLFGQFMVETMFITLLAAGVACLLTTAFLPFLREWINIPLYTHIEHDYQLVIFFLTLIMAVIFTAGFYPSLVLSGFKPVEALKSKLSARHIGGFAIRKGLVITQFTISQILIIGTLVVIRQLDYFKNKDLGMNKDLIVQVSIPKPDKSTMNALRNRLMEMPVVQQASFFRFAPAAELGSGGSVKYDNRDWEKFVGMSKTSDSHFLETYGIKLITGRNIVESDTLRELLVNEAFVKKLGIRNNQDVLNKKLLVGDANNKTGIIVGVVKDFSLRQAYFPIDPTVIFSQATRYRTIGIKLKGNDLQSSMAQIQKTWQSFYPNNVFEYQFFDEQVAQFYEREEVLSKLVNVFAILAIFIGCLGLYGLVSFMAAQRTKEIGIRKVLGASIESILLLFGKEFGKLILIAFFIAAPLGWWIMNKWLQDYAYHIEIGVGIFVTAIVATLIIASLTVSYRAIRAALMNPVKSLKTE